MSADPAEIRRAALLEAADALDRWADTEMSGALGCDSAAGRVLSRAARMVRRMAHEKAAIRERVGQPADAERIAELEAHEMLEKWGDYPILVSGLKAAEAQVAALREENGRLREALRPFANSPEGYPEHLRGYVHRARAAQAIASEQGGGK